MCRQTVFTYRDKVTEQGLAGLLQREHGSGQTPTVRGVVAQEFVEKLERGEFRQARDAQKWIEKRTRRKLSESGVRVHAPYKTVYEWGYLHEALEVDGRNKVELLFTPNINQDIHAIFLRQIAQSDPKSTHVVIMDQAGFHLQDKDPRVPENIRLLSLPAYSPELNPAEWFGRVVKAPTINRLYRNLRALKDHLIRVARDWSKPEKVQGRVHQWMQDQVNATAPI